MNTVKPDRRSSPWPVMLAALACLVGSAQVLAAAPEQTHSVAVRYTDLDLTSSAGAAALYDRIQAAAREVCASDQDHQLAVLTDMNRCKSGATAHAVATVNAPLLTAIHNAHQGANLTAMLSE